jgi:tRNA (Thr-GGU) A37 N-methylase
MHIHCTTIGTVEADAGFRIRIAEAFRPGLSGLVGFSHLQILWFANQGVWQEEDIQIPKPYRLAPAQLGIFATRSPLRPNSICVSVVPVADLDEVQGTIDCYYLDALAGTPVLDIKPWLACCDLPAQVRYPEWCKHWPKNLEASGAFPWDQEFCFY